MRRADAAVLTALALVLGGGYAAAVFGHYLLSDDYAWLAELLQGHPLGRQMRQRTVARGCIRIFAWISPQQREQLVHAGHAQRRVNRNHAG